MINIPTGRCIKQFTAEEEELLRDMWLGGGSDSSMAKSVGATLYRVRRWRERNGYKCNRVEPPTFRRALTPLERDSVFCYYAGISYGDLSTARARGDREQLKRWEAKAAERKEAEKKRKNSNTWATVYEEK